MRSTKTATLPFYLSSQDPPAKQEMLRAALRLFVHKGLCETSIRDIAEQAGYTNPALFKHFSGKDALALYLFEQCYTLFATELRVAVESSESFESQLSALIRTFALLLDEHPEAFLYLNDNLRHFWPQVRPGMRQRSMVALIRRVLQSGIDRGELRADLHADMCTAGWIGVLTQFARLHYFNEFKGPALSWTSELERVIRAMLNG